jgi:hypothetical protein
MKTLVEGGPPAVSTMLCRSQLANCPAPCEALCESSCRSPRQLGLRFARTLEGHRASHHAPQWDRTVSTGAGGEATSPFANRVNEASQVGEAGGAGEAGTAACTPAKAA